MRRLVNLKIFVILTPQSGKGVCCSDFVKLGHRVGDISTLGHCVVGCDVEFHFDYLFLLVVPYYIILREVCQGVLGKKLKNILFIIYLQKMVESFTFKNFGPCTRSRPTKKRTPRNYPRGCSHHR